MTDSSNVFSSRPLGFFAVALVALAALPACGTRLHPTVAEVSGRKVEIVETDKGGATVVFESGFGDGWSPFGPYPVRVLTATSHPWPHAVEVMWETMLGSLADEADDGEQVLFAGAGHYLQIERSHKVAQETLDLVPED